MSLTVIGVLSYWQFSRYQFVFWGLSIINMVFVFASLYEVFVHTLKPYSAMIDLAKMLFYWAGTFLLIVGLITAFFTRYPTQGPFNWFFSGMEIADHSLRLMQCGLLLLLLLFERRLGLSWRSRGMSIALGLGSSAAVSLTAAFLRKQFHDYRFQVDLVNGMFYLLVTIFWAASLFTREPTRRNVLDSPSRLIFQRWNEALSSSQLVQQGGEMAFSSVDSFIPGVEKAVDRVLAKKIVE